jgi:hypothetical protein
MLQPAIAFCIHQSSPDSHRLRRYSCLH